MFCFVPSTEKMCKLLLRFAGECPFVTFYELAPMSVYYYS